MGLYYETLKNFTPVPSRIEIPKNQNRSFDKEGFIEREALDIIFGLSAIAHGLALKGYMNKFSQQAGDCLDLTTYFPQNLTRETKIKSIEEKRKILIPCFVTEEDKTAAGIHGNEISLLGIAALGLTGVIFVDRVGEAAIKHHALSLMFKDDPLAGLVFASYPEQFNGFSSAEELSKMETGLKNDQIRKIYSLANLR